MVALPTLKNVYKRIIEQLLKLILPSQVNTTLKIDNLGEIKILDLTEEQMKYKDTIGQLILEVNFLMVI